MPNEIQIATNPVMQMLAAAVDKGSDASVKELVQILREERDYNAQLAFNQAMHRCQQQMKPISADMENPQTHSKYASYAQVDRAIRPVYTKEGLSLSFGDGEPIASDFIRILCYVSHIEGHTRMYHKDMPIVTLGPQGKAVMTATHAHGSADAYAKRYLVKDIFNLSIGEKDDDGNGDNPKIPSDKVGEWLKGLQEAEDLTSLMKLWGKIYTTTTELGDENAKQILIPAYETRKGELA
jgi:hypothetical protein